MFDVDMYCTEGSNVPLKKYLKDVARKYGERDLILIKTYISLLEDHGMRINEYRPQAIKQIEGDLYELRPGNNRVFFFYYKDKRFVLLHGFRKKGRKTPLHEIETARKRMEDFIRRYS